MRKYLLLSSIIILIVYYISTFLISFTLLAKSVINNDSVSLGGYINVKSLRNNFYDDIYEFSSNLINVIDKNIRIKSESVELSAELTPAFLEKLFSKIANNISTDFSNPEIMLYFYLNSKELDEYLNKSFINFGDYNFKKFLLEKQPEDPGPASTSNEQPSSSSTSNQEAENKKEEEEESLISKLIKRYKSTDYFFLTSPIHFKIDVKHQDIPFILILKFNGYIWEVQKITIPYKKLIDPKNISLNN